LRIDLERATQQAQVDLQALQREVNGNLQRRVRTVLDQLMANQPYQLVINSDSSLVWSAPELDLTTAVVARMNGQ
jgi:Skp family chaperone for outer membrane proteins